MLPSIVRETAVMIAGMIRCSRAEPRGSSRLSTAANIRGMSMMQEEGQEDRGDEAENQAEAGDDDADHAAGGVADRLCDLLDVLLSLLRGAAVVVDPRAERRVADVLHDRRQRVDEVADSASTSGETSRNAMTAPRTTSPRTTIVAVAPRPSLIRGWSSRTTGSRTNAAKRAKKSVSTVARIDTSAQPTAMNAAATNSVRTVMPTASARLPAGSEPEAFACMTTGTRPARGLLHAREQAHRMPAVRTALQGRPAICVGSAPCRDFGHDAAPRCS